MGSPPYENHYPSALYAWYVSTVLMVANIVSFIDRQIISLLIEPIKADLSLTDTQISILHGFAFAIFYALMGLPWAGWRIEKTAVSLFQRHHGLESHDSLLRFG